MQSAERAKKILEAIWALPPREVCLMEVCGTHTMAIAEAGIRTLLPPEVKLLSGPGCPVCVTPPEEIDAMLALSAEPGVILTTYGDMLRVPGSRRGDSLIRRRALGADVRVVYSPVDAIKIAEENPQKEVVFLGVGFETTAPGTAAAVRTAAEKDVKNFPWNRPSVRSSRRTMSGWTDSSARAMWPRSSAKKASAFFPRSTGNPP